MKIPLLFFFILILCIIPIQVEGVPTQGTFTPLFTEYAPVQSNHLIWNGITEKLLNATNVNVSSTSINFTISDANNNTMDWYCYLNNSGVWELIDDASGVRNSTISITNTSWFIPLQNYSISFNVTDSFNWTNASYWFVTDYSVPLIYNPNPSNNSIVTTDLCNWSITITDFVPFNWTIECSEGNFTNGTLDTNRTFYLNITNLTQYTTYIFWVNATNTYNRSTHKIFYFNTSAFEVIGDFLVWVKRQEATVIPILGTGVTKYKWNIKGDISGESEWIDADVVEPHHFFVNWGQKYLITLTVSNETYSRKIGKYIKIQSDPDIEIEYDPFTGEVIEEEEEVTEGNESRFKNPFENVVIDRIYIISIIVIFIIGFFVLFVERGKKQLYVRQRRKMYGRREKK